jgi:hypothetical protein
MVVNGGCHSGCNSRHAKNLHLLDTCTHPEAEIIFTILDGNKSQDMAFRGSPGEVEKSLHRDPEKCQVIWSNRSVRAKPKKSTMEKHGFSNVFAWFSHQKPYIHRGDFQECHHLRSMDSQEIKIDDFVNGTMKLKARFVVV